MLWKSGIERSSYPRLGHVAIGIMTYMYDIPYNRGIIDWTDCKVDVHPKDPNADSKVPYSIGKLDPSVYWRHAMHLDQRRRYPSPSYFYQTLMRLVRDKLPLFLFDRWRAR